MSADEKSASVAAVRVRAGEGIAVRVFAGSVAWTVEGRTRFRAGSLGPSALDALLGALGADLVLGFTHAARRAGVALRELELTLAAQVENALVPLGVEGEEGSPALSAITGTAYASADAEPSRLRELWDAARARSPVCATLARATPITVELRIVP